MTCLYAHFRTILVCLDVKQLVIVDPEISRFESKIDLTGVRQHILSWLLSCLDLLYHIVQRHFLIHHLLQKLRVLRIKQHVRVFTFFAVERAYDFPEPYVPHDKEKPVSHNQFPFSFQCSFILKILGHLCYGMSMRPILFKVSDKECAIHAL